MPHPYFDSIVFPWHRADAQQLLEVLKVVAPDAATIENLYVSCKKGLPPLTPARVDNMWIEALNHLAVAGALEELCDLLLVRPLAPVAQHALKQVKLGNPDVGEPDGVSGPIVLDRGKLRHKIQRLTPATSALKVLVVRGEPSSGKSHGRHLFEQAARGQNAQPVYLYADHVANLEEVLLQLFGALRATSKIPPPGDTTGSAYHRKVWVTLREIADSEKRPLWIAVDDLGVAADGGPLLDGEIRQFFDQLVLMLLNPIYRDWFRLMLIHYPDGKVPSRWHGDVWAEERTSAGDVQPEHVAQELKAWYQRHGHTVLDEEINAQAADIVSRSDKPSGVCRLKQIHDSVYEIFESGPEGTR